MSLLSFVKLCPVSLFWMDLLHTMQLFQLQFHHGPLYQVSLIYPAFDICSPHHTLISKIAIIFCTSAFLHFYSTILFALLFISNSTNHATFQGLVKHHYLQAASLILQWGFPCIFFLFTLLLYQFSLAFYYNLPFSALKLCPVLYLYFFKLHCFPYIHMFICFTART